MMRVIISVSRLSTHLSHILINMQAIRVMMAVAEHVLRDLLLLLKRDVCMPEGECTM